MAPRLPVLDLGRGWGFPPEFHEAGGTVRMVSDVQDIRESLFILLSTVPGERVMLPDYGCDLTSFVFRGVTPALIEELRDIVSVAIRRWEPRIDLLACVASIDALDPALVRIELDYRIRRTGVAANYVHALYIAGDVPRLEQG